MPNKVYIVVPGELHPYPGIINREPREYPCMPCSFKIKK